MKRLISLCLSSVLLSGVALAAVPGQQEEGKTTEQGRPTEQGQITEQGRPTEQGQTTQTPQTPGMSTEGQSAQQGASEEVTSQQVSAEERSLVLTVHAANLGEIKASLIAFTRPVSQEIRDFAWRVINDHLQNDHMLQELSRTNGLDLVSEESIQVLAPMLSEQKEMLTTLEDTAVADFEQAYIDLMRKNHEELVTQLDSAAAKFTDSRFSEYIRTTSDSVKLHIADLQRLVEQQEAAGDANEPADVQKPAKGEKIDIEVGEEIGEQGKVGEEIGEQGKVGEEIGEQGKVGEEIGEQGKVGEEAPAGDVVSAD